MISQRLVEDQNSLQPIVEELMELLEKSGLLTVEVKEREELVRRKEDSRTDGKVMETSTIIRRQRLEWTDREDQLLYAAAKVGKTMNEILAMPEFRRRNKRGLIDHWPMVNRYAQKHKLDPVPRPVWTRLARRHPGHDPEKKVARTIVRDDESSSSSSEQ